jgi:hypothetical protein
MTDDKLTSTLEKALQKTRESMEILGMVDDLKENNEWKAPMLAESMKGMDVDEEDEDEHDDQKANGDDKINNTDEDIITDGLIEDLSKLHDLKVIDDSVKKKAKDHLLTKKSLPSASVGIPQYDKPESDKESTSLYVEVTINNEVAMIRKQRAVWLFQETKRVSSDRLLRV